MQVLVLFQERENKVQLVLGETNHQKVHGFKETYTQMGEKLKFLSGVLDQHELPEQLLCSFA